MAAHPNQKFVAHMKGVTKRFTDGNEVLKGIWLSFYYGAKIGIIGPNGAGKSTLMKIMAKLDDEFEGEFWLEPNMTVGYLEQEPKLDHTKNVRENVELGVAPIKALLAEYERVNERFAEEMSDDEMDKLIARQAELQDKIDATNAWEIDRMLEIAMDALRVPDGNSRVDTLSGGERRRVALCRLLLEKPDLLLLDEPTNHLDAESVAWLERTLHEYAGTVILITHDRYFLDNVTKWILEMEAGKGTPFEGNYSTWLEKRKIKLQEAEKSESARAKELERELEWVRMGAKARQAKSKARLRRYEDMLVEQQASAQSKVRQTIVIPPGPRLGDIVVRARGLRKAFGDKLLIDDLSFDLPKNGIVGVVGPNGAGKTTLFKMILGEEKPEGGELMVGDTVRTAHVGQFRDGLDPKKSVWENISGGHMLMKVGNREMNSRAYVSEFGFPGARQQQAVGTLSGGERNRVHLAMLLQAGGNLILLDEPSNDLDVATIRALEDALEEFAGCAMVISHDRWFLDRVATHILAFEGDSKVVWYEGNYADYEEDRHKRLGTDADQPHRIKYKPLTR